MTVGASNASGERQRLFERAMVPQSNSIKEGYALCHTSVSGDNLAVDVPSAAAALAGGRAFAGISAAQGTVNVAYDNSITVQKAGIAKCALKANTACTAGTEAGYDPADGGPVQPVTPLNAGVLVVIGRFTQTKSSSSSEQFVGVELHANGSGSAEQVLNASLAAGATLTNTTTETALSAGFSIPASRITAAGTVIRVRARVRIPGTHTTDTLRIRARLESAAGTLLGASPAVDVANGDMGLLDLTLTVRSVGASGTLSSAGLGVVAASSQVTGSATFTFDTTVAHLIVITGEWSVADAGNQAYLDDFVVTILG